MDVEYYMYCPIKSMFWLLFKYVSPLFQRKTPLEDGEKTVHFENYDIKTKGIDKTLKIVFQIENIR